MLINLDNYQNFLSNTIFFDLLLTMSLYWVSLILVDNPVLYKAAKLGGKTSNLMLFIYLSWRWYNYGFFPLSNLYESLMFLGCLLLFLYQFIEYKTNSKVIGALILPLIVLIQGFASLSLPTAMQKSTPLVPALQSNWLMLHVSMMMLSYATLLLGSLFSLLYLNLYKDKTVVKEQSDFEKSSSQKYLLKVNASTLSFEQSSNLEKTTTLKSRSQLLNSLDNWSYRTIGLGFPFLTMGIISGAVWANEAWGSYWSWDPKETWALITWLIFASYLHARLTKGWSGKKTAILGSLGFFIVWICYLGVNFLGKGLHSYGWLS
uniref:cytochrome c biogenesis protein n=1 Tax=Chattonella marina TaxID=90936 RepID=UPI0021151847|nr:cytochrome c biogenesis protein [Chattonella marina]UTE94830.1 cytochrome c biogenesis protein [Chattonella marina]